MRYTRAGLEREIVTAIQGERDGEFALDVNLFAGRPLTTEVENLAEFVVVVFSGATYATRIDAQRLETMTHTVAVHARDRSFLFGAHATGTIRVMGTAGAVLAFGTIFETPAGVRIFTSRTATIPDGGSVDIPAQADRAGEQGNLSVGTALMLDADSRLGSDVGSASVIDPDPPNPADYPNPDLMPPPDPIGFVGGNPPGGSVDRILRVLEQRLVGVAIGVGPETFDESGTVFVPITLTAG